MVVQAVAKRIYSGGPFSKSKFARWYSRFRYMYGWEGRQYGLHYHDACLEWAPEVQEALRRYRLADPYGYDLRHQRLTRANVLMGSAEHLPKEEWTKYEEDSWYLGSFLEEIEHEKVERARTSGLKPGYQLKKQL